MRGRKSYASALLFHVKIHITTHRANDQCTPYVSVANIRCVKIRCVPILVPGNARALAVGRESSINQGLR